MVMGLRVPIRGPPKVPRTLVRTAERVEFILGLYGGYMGLYWDSGKYTGNYTLNPKP